MSDDIEPAIIIDGKPMTAAEYLRHEVKQYTASDKKRVKLATGRRKFAIVVGRTGREPSRLFHAVKLARQFDGNGNVIGYAENATTLCGSHCAIVSEMESFDGCCDGRGPDEGTQCEKCLALLNGEVG